MSNACLPNSLCVVMVGRHVQITTLILFSELTSEHPQNYANMQFYSADSESGTRHASLHRKYMPTCYSSHPLV